jgi:hypothetical protein
LEGRNDRAPYYTNKQPEEDRKNIETVENSEAWNEGMNDREIIGRKCSAVSQVSKEGMERTDDIESRDSDRALYTRESTET